MDRDLAVVLKRRVRDLLPPNTPTRPGVRAAEACAESGWRRLDRMVTIMPRRSPGVKGKMKRSEPNPPACRKNGGRGRNLGRDSGIDVPPVPVNAAELKDLFEP